MTVIIDDGLFAGMLLLVMLEVAPTLDLPLLYTDSGTIRRVGIEFEFAGISLDVSAQAIQDVFGGSTVTTSSYIRRVRGTEHGDFTVEIDTSYLKEKRYEAILSTVGLGPRSFDSKGLEESLLSFFSNFVPFEVSTPPIPIPKLAKVDELRDRLRLAGAKGTQASIFYAFGLHLNPEIPSMDFRVIAAYLKAFLLLAPWIRKQVKVDLTRRMSPYVASFGDDYTRLVLTSGYPKSVDELVHDYLTYNPTRNRALDMLPVLSLFDEELVKLKAEQPNLVRARKAFHYRLPNCLIDDPSWRVSHEWRTWCAVERLAADPARIEELSRQYFEALENSFKPFYDEWPSVLDEYLGAGG